MVKKNSQTHNFEIKNFKDVYDYCYLNGVMDVNSFVNDCFKKGFDIERYGLLSEGNPTLVEKEVIVEKIVEKIVEIPVTKEIIVEKIIEKEVPVSNEVFIEKIIEKEVPIEKIVYVETTDNTKEEKLKLLQNTLLNLKKELSFKDEKIKELENKIIELETLTIKQGVIFLKGSNLNQSL